MQFIFYWIAYLLCSVTLQIDDDTKKKYIDGLIHEVETKKPENSAGNRRIELERVNVFYIRNGRRVRNHQTFIEQ